jgi:hypothetical protein
MALPAAKERIITALQQGEIRLEGQFLNSSNYTFLGDLVYEDLKLRVVYKPMRGEQPLWDFPVNTLTRRETAAYLVSEILGWNMVPPTVFRRRKAPLGSGSLQLFIPHDPEYNYFRFNPEDIQRLRPVVAFDLLINNADRKGGHILCDETSHLWVIDHGVCFNVEDKLRTVIWNFVGETIPADLLEDMRRFASILEARGEDYNVLTKMLQPSEVQAMLRRTRRLLGTCLFPEPDTTRRSYPWPPV